MRIGLISDTHGYLDPRVLELFAGVEHILHAGDVGRMDVVFELRTIAPVTAVLGNVDFTEMGLRLTERVALGQLKFLLHHIVNPQQLAPPLREEVAEFQPDVVVFGHSHTAYNRRWGETRFVNPGYAGAQRFAQPRSVAIATITGRQIEVESLPL